MLNINQNRAIIYLTHLRSPATMSRIRLIIANRITSQQMTFRTCSHKGGDGYMNFMCSSSKRTRRSISSYLGSYFLTSSNVASAIGLLRAFSSCCNFLTSSFAFLVSTRSLRMPSKPRSQPAPRRLVSHVGSQTGRGMVRLPCEVEGLSSKKPALLDGHCESGS
ncbi:MAG: hypothetical protein QOD28_1119 [Acidobacteriota bacterium]|nr:hypothetical protein [Acidobacteriota bacterium]